MLMWISEHMLKFTLDLCDHFGRVWEEDAC
jgi:hypothetical protein